MNNQLKNYLSLTSTATLTAILISIPSPVKAISLIGDRASLASNDQIDWSSLGPVNPFNILPNSFSTTSANGLGLNVEIPTQPGLTPPFVFQTLPAPGIETNFANSDYILFTGFIPGPPPAIGNPGPLTITFDTPVMAAGTQIAVDDTLNFTAFISAFDNNNNLLGSFSAIGTSSLELDNSALFLGVTSDIANISRLVFSTSVPERAIGINTLSLKTASVPESSLTLGLLLLGGCSIVSTLKRKLN